MPEVTIDAKHERLQAFLGAKGFHNVRAKQTLALTDKETDRLLKAAKREGYEDQITVKGGKAKVQARAKIEETQQEKVATATLEVAEETAEEETEDVEEKTTQPVPRRRRV